MKDKVIKTAGKIWRVLGEKGQVTIPQLAKSIKEKEDIVNQSIGWLAREDKIKYIIEKKKVFVTLVDSEKQMFDVVSATQWAKK